MDYQTSVEYEQAESYTCFITLIDSYLEEAQTYVCLTTSSLIILVLSGRYGLNEIFYK